MSLWWSWVRAGFLIWSELLKLAIYFWQRYLVNLNVDTGHHQAIILIWLIITRLIHTLSVRASLSLKRLGFFKARNKIFRSYSQSVIEFCIQFSHKKTCSIPIVWACSWSIKTLCILLISSSMPILSIVLMQKWAVNGRCQRRSLRFHLCVVWEIARCWTNI